MTQHVIIKTIKCSELNRVYKNMPDIEIVVKYDADNGEPRGIQCKEYSEEDDGVCRLISDSNLNIREYCTFKKWKEIK